MTSQGNSSRASEVRRKRIYDDSGKNVTPKSLRYKSLSNKSLKSRESIAKSSTRPPSNKSSEVTIYKDTLEAKDYLQALILAKKNIEEKKYVITKSVPKCTFTVLLQETDTLCLLDLQSMNMIKNSNDDCNKVHDKTPRYLVESFAQTFGLVQKKKLCQTILTRYNNSCVFASEWDLYDTYRKVTVIESKTKIESVNEEGCFKTKIFKDSKEQYSINTTSNSLTESIQSKMEGQEVEKQKISSKVKKVFQLPEFKYAVAVAERLLASNIFYQEQATFMSPVTNQDSSSFHYVLKLLWSFSYFKVVNRTVTAISLNAANKNIIAVGYGKYAYKDNFNGLVCCWSVKNPNQPERAYAMETAVTTLSFSQTQPNLLAVGCYDGSITVLNITTTSGDPLKVNRKTNYLQFGPVWKVQWFKYTDYVIEREEIISVGQNGLVCKWNHKEDACSYILMKLDYSPPILKFNAMNREKKRNVDEVSRKHLSALSISLHPKDPMMYYVGTQQGCVVKCAMNNQDQFMDIFRAHSGPVYGICHSPFCSNIFLTYGSDRVICLWTEFLNEPLICLYWTKAPIEGAVWSPTYSTILATVSGDQLAIWDISRKIIVPISVIKSPSGRRFSCIDFSSTGKNILAGDMEGNVHVFNLKDMPYAPFLQEEALIRALDKSLVSKPEIIRKLKKNKNTHF